MATGPGPSLDAVWNACAALAGSRLIEAIATDSSGQSATASVRVDNASLPPTLTGLAGQRAAKLTVTPRCGTPSGFELRQVTPSATTHAVTLGTFTESPLTPAVAHTFRVAARWGALVGPESDPFVVTPRWTCISEEWCVDSPVLGNTELRAVADDGTRVWVAGDLGFVARLDGTTWTRELLPGVESTVLGIAVGDNDVVVAATADGLWRRSPSGSWREATHVPAGDLTGVVWLGPRGCTASCPKRGFVAGATGTLWWSTDGSAFTEAPTAWRGGGSLRGLSGDDLSRFRAFTSLEEIEFRLSPTDVATRATAPRPGIKALARGAGADWTLADGRLLQNGVDVGPSSSKGMCGFDTGMVESGSGTATTVHLIDGGTLSLGTGQTEFRSEWCESGLSRIHELSHSLLSRYELDGGLPQIGPGHGDFFVGIGLSGGKVAVGGGGGLLMAGSYPNWVVQSDAQVRRGSSQCSGRPDCLAIVSGSSSSGRVEFIGIRNPGSQVDLHSFANDRWSVRPSPLTKPTAVAAVGQTTYLLDQTGLLTKSTGASWTRDQDTGLAGSSLLLSAASSGFTVVADRVSLRKSTGGAFSDLPPPPLMETRGVVAVSPGEVWAAGVASAGSGIARWNGVTWVDANPTVFQSIFGMFSNGQGDIWFAGPDAVSRWDGSRFEDLPLPAGYVPYEFALIVVGDGDVWFTNGLHILHRGP